MFDGLTNEGMLDGMLLDLTITRLKYRVHTSEYQWKKWIRTA